MSSTDTDRQLLLFDGLNGFGKSTVANHIPIVGVHGMTLGQSQESSPSYSQEQQ